MIGQRTHCISCGSQLLSDVVFIGEQYPSAVYPMNGEDYNKFIQKSSLNVTKCSDAECSLVQLTTKYSLDYVFEHYPYVSGSTATMQQILKDLVVDAETHVKLTDQDVVLDIGGNDGTLLNCLSTKVKNRVNIDAAHGIDSVINDPNYTRIQSKFDAQAYRSLDLPAPKLIFSVAMFYHLDNPHSFCESVADVMSDESVWVIQMTYLGSMLSANIYDNIVHEHVAYYSLASLEHLLKRKGLEVFDAQVVKSYGGSIRAYVKKISKKNGPTPKTKSYEALVQHEKETGMNTLEALERFNERTQFLRTVTRNWIFHVVEQTGPMFALGASTKGNMICQFLGINKDHVKAVLDNNDKKIGSLLVGSDIPILNEKEYLPQLSKYSFVLPYYYTDFFKKLVKPHVPAGQTKYLFTPLPEPNVIPMGGA